MFEFFNKLKTIALVLLFAVTVGSCIAMAVGGLFFNFDPMTVLSLVLICLGAVVGVLLAIALVAMLCWFLFSNPYVICWLGVGALIVAAVWFAFMGSSEAIAFILS